MNNLDTRIKLSREREAVGLCPFLILTNLINSSTYPSNSLLIMLVIFLISAKDKVKL